MLVANLVEAYRRSSPTLEWMSAETRERALDKLDAFTPKIGYPVKWRDYSTLEIDAADLRRQRRGARTRSRSTAQLGKIGKPIDRDEWFMTPQTVNAYYNPLHERDRLPRGDPAAAVLRRGPRTPRPTTAASAR